MERSFSQWKQQVLGRVDLSRKGSVDEDVVQLVALLNGCQMFFTTSSCSGRVTVMDVPSDSRGPTKQDSVWLFVSHQRCRAEELWSAVERSSGDAVMKFEPFVLHVQCRGMEDAQLLHSVAVQSGCRNSGLTVGRKGKIMAAVRCSPGLEVPLSHRGRPLVDPQYVGFLAQRANEKMEENLRRIQRFYQNLQSCLDTEKLQTLQITVETEGEDPPERRPHHVYRRKRKQGRAEQPDSCHGDGGSCVSELEDCLDLFI